MKIYDCFTFYNEFEILEIRLHELASIVDYFILVEATKTHSGVCKPLFFSENRDRYKCFSDRIIHVVVDDMPIPDDGNRWLLENHQRRCIARGLMHCRPNDLILISDVDEMPSIDLISNMRNQITNNCFMAELGEIIYEKFLFFQKIKIPIVNKVFRKFSKLFIPKSRIVKCLHRHYEYYLNGYVTDDLRGTTFIRFSTLKRIFNKDTNAARWLRNMPHDLTHGGWHFSYLGNASQIAKKIHSFAHSEFDTGKYTDLAYIEDKIEKGENLFGKKSEKNKIKYVEIDDTWPTYVLQNKNLLSKFIKPISKRQPNKN